jgi:hypothetical protein
LCVLSVGVAMRLGPGFDTVPVTAAGSSWSSAARLTHSTRPAALGAFARADGSFLVSGWTDISVYPYHTGGYSAGKAGGAFSKLTGEPLLGLVPMPKGASLIAWNVNSVQVLGANGKLAGKPQLLPFPIDALAADSHGNATAAGVSANGLYELDAAVRPEAGPGFGRPRRSP